MSTAILQLDETRLKKDMIESIIKQMPPQEVMDEVVAADTGEVELDKPEKLSPPPFLGFPSPLLCRDEASDGQADRGVG